MMEETLCCCKKCGVMKPLTDFSKDRNYRKNSCKACEVIRAAEYKKRVGYKQPRSQKGDPELEAVVMARILRRGQTMTAMWNLPITEWKSEWLNDE